MKARRIFGVVIALGARHGREKRARAAGLSVLLPARDRDHGGCAGARGRAAATGQAACLCRSAPVCRHAARPAPRHRVAWLVCDRAHQCGRPATTASPARSSGALLRELRPATRLRVSSLSGHAFAWRLSPSRRSRRGGKGARNGARLDAAPPPRVRASGEPRRPATAGLDRTRRGMGRGNCARPMQPSSWQPQRLP